MAIMPTLFDPGGSGSDPFVTDMDVDGRVTHGHLPENDGHGGGRFSGLSDPRDLLSRPVGQSGRVAIQGFVYGQGDLSHGPPRAPGAPRADLRQPRCQADDLPHHHRLQGALQPHHRDRVSAGRRQGRLRLG